MKFDPITHRMIPDAEPVAVMDLSVWEPYRPPWYPHDDDPWTIIGNMSGTIVTRYSAWCDSLPPGELHRLIAAHAVARATETR